MKRKQEDLIRYLYEHEEKLTSETLSKALSLSILYCRVESQLSGPHPFQ